MANSPRLSRKEDLFQPNIGKDAFLRVREEDDTCPARYVIQLNSIVILLKIANIYLDFTAYQTLCKILYIHYHLIFPSILGSTLLHMSILYNLWVLEYLVPCPRWTVNKWQNPICLTPKPVLLAIPHTASFIGMTDVTGRSYSNPVICSKEPKLHN